MKSKNFQIILKVLLLLITIGTNAEDSKVSEVLENNRESKSVSQFPFGIFKRFTGTKVIPDQNLEETHNQGNTDGNNDEPLLILHKNNVNTFEEKEDDDYDDSNYNDDEITAEKTEPRLFFKKLLLGKFFKQSTPTIIKVPKPIPIPIPVFIGGEPDTNTETFTGTGTATLEGGGDQTDGTDNNNGARINDRRYSYYGNDDYDYDFEDEFIPPSGLGRSSNPELSKNSNSKIHLRTRKQKPKRKAYVAQYPEYYEQFLRQYKNLVQKQYRNQKRRLNLPNKSDALNKNRHQNRTSNTHRFIKIKRTRNRRKPQQ